MTSDASARREPQFLQRQGPHGLPLCPRSTSPHHTDLFTMDVCPRKTCRHCPVRTSHFLMVRSALHVKAASSSSWQKVT